MAENLTISEDLDNIYKIISLILSFQTFLKFIFRRLFVNIKYSCFELYYPLLISIYYSIDIVCEFLSNSINFVYLK